jgi:hypothetical protein
LLTEHWVVGAAAVALVASAGCGGDEDGGPPSRQEARRCLERLDLHVTPFERSLNDDDGPAAWLDANDVLEGRVRLEARYWDDGRVTMHWIWGRKSRLAPAARDCVL